MADETPDQSELRVDMDARDFGGVWANFARVSHSEHEFTLDFVRVDYASQPLQGMVVARVNVSPLWKKYARKAMPEEVRDGDDE